MNLKQSQDFYKMNRQGWNDLPPAIKNYEMNNLAMFHSAIFKDSDLEQEQFKIEEQYDRPNS